jgi:tetratricopeptide (TPR) repeat protein
MGGVIASALILASTAMAQQAKQPNWKDINEYNLVQEIGKEANPAKKLALLQSWKEKYPATDFAVNRLGMFLVTYQQMGKAAEMLAIAKELTTAAPDAIEGPYWITLLTVSIGNDAPDALDAGEKAANTLIAGLDKYFDPAKKPAGTTDAQLKTQRDDTEAKAHLTLGWIATKRKNFEMAEKEYARVLELEPNNAQASYFLANAILAQRKPEKQVPALFHFARAAALTGPGALPDANRKSVLEYLTKYYTQYHGSKEGLDSLMAMAKNSVMPPADLAVKTAMQVVVEQEEEFKKSNPQLALWMGVKKALVGPEGSAYFDASLKDAALPKLKGKIVSMKPALKPKEIVLALSDASTPEVTLKIAEGGFLPGKAEPGTEIEFEEAVAKSFTADPFMLTAEVEKSKLSGWPAQAAPAKPRPGGAKKATGKKK